MSDIISRIGISRSGSAKDYGPQIIFAAALVPRVIAHLAYVPWWAGDSFSYYNPAYLLNHGIYHTYDAGRTSIYPLLLYLGELFGDGTFKDRLSTSGAEVVTWALSIIGAASAVLLLWACRSIAFSCRASACIALLFALATQPAIFDMILVPEALSTYSLIAGLYLLLRCYRAAAMSTRPAVWAGVAAGLWAGISTLIRPNNLVFFAVFFAVSAGLVCFNWWRGRGRDVRADLRMWAAASISFATTLLGWMAVNQANTGFFILTPMTGMTRSSAAYNLFGEVAPKDKVLGEIMHKTYLKTNANGVTTRDYIWQALPEVYARANEMPYDKSRDRYSGVISLSRYIGSVSQELLKRHPRRWLENAFDNFKDTFVRGVFVSTVENVVDPQAIAGGTVVKFPSVAGPLAAVTDVEGYLWLGAYLLV